MSFLGQTARFLRDQRRMTQCSAARALGVSNVHLSNVERGKTEPSTRLLERLKGLFGVDLHILAWCLFEDDRDLPESLRVHRRHLAREWRQLLSKQIREGGQPKRCGLG
jgi:transcriptional regulator with XRE-family HTH domain